MIYIELCFLFMAQVTIVTNDIELPVWLNKLYPYTNRVSGYAEASTVMTITNQSGEYTFCYEGRLICGLSRNGLYYVVYEVLQEIAEKNFLSYRTDVLHGACVEKEGKALVFLAGTNTGKSTLTAELIHQGYRYISDDYVILSKDNTGIIPFHLPLKLRTLEFTSTVEENQIVVRDFNPVKNENYYLIQPEAFSQNKIYPVQAVFQIERTQNENIMRRLKCNEAFGTIVSYSKIADRNSIKKLMTSALSLARIIEVYKIYFTRTENCINYIKKTIGEKQDV